MSLPFCVNPMAKKKQQPTAPVLTRGQLSRRAREQQQIRNLYTAIVGVGTLVVLILLFAVVSTYILKPNEEVASVNGVKITRSTYDKLRRYNVYQDQRLQALQGSGSSLTSASTTTLQDVDKETTLDATTVNQLVDSELLRQSAKSDATINIAATDADLKAAAIKDFVPAPQAPTPTAGPATAVVTATQPFTPTATRTFTPGPPTQTPTVTATYPPVPGAQQTAETDYATVMKGFAKGVQPITGDAVCNSGCPNISENDYLHLVEEPRYLQDKVTEKLSASVVTTTEQIHAQHILTDTEAGAQKILDMLNKGADFTKTANEQSSEQIQKQGKSPLNGGDLGWFPKEGSGLVQEFVDGAWPIQAGQYTKTPVKTTFGYHIIKVLERDPKRPLTDQQISDAKSKKYQDWFSAQKAKANITTKLPASAQPTQPAIIEPTQPAGTSTTPTAGTGAGATTPATTPGATEATPASQPTAVGTPKQ